MKFLVSLFLLILTATAFGNSLVAPVDLNMIAAKIAARQQQTGKLPRNAGKIVFKGDQILFVVPSEALSSVYFNKKAPTIDKHFRLKSERDEYRFEVFLKHGGGPFTYEVAPVNGADALFCFGDNDVFIYTQEEGDGGALSLKEWIYVKKPNISNGSQWVWVFKSEPWQWPLTVALGKDGVAMVDRNMPFVGIPIEDKARSQYMLNVMVKFKANEPVKKYFPFAEPLVSMPQAHVTNKEGVTKVVDVHVQNVSVENTKIPQPKVGFDMRRWDDHWHSVYTVAVSAKRDEYPLLIE